MRFSKVVLFIGFWAFLFYFGINSLKELPVPTLDIPEELTPEGQSKENIEEKANIERDFNESQGFMSADEIEKESDDNNNASIVEDNAIDNIREQ